MFTVMKTNLKLDLMSFYAKSVTNLSTNYVLQQGS